jgi:hypothetical protein
MEKNSVVVNVATGTLTYEDGMWKWLENNAVEYRNESLEKLVEHVAKDRFSNLMWSLRLLRHKFLNTVHPAEDKVDIWYAALHYSGPYREKDNTYYMLEGIPVYIIKEGRRRHVSTNPLTALDAIFSVLTYAELTSDMYEALNQMQVSGLLAEEYEKNASTYFGVWPGGAE